MAFDNDALIRLVKSAADGDDNAFSELVKIFEKTIYNMAMQSLHNREDALDLSQDVFLKLWRALPSFRGECSVASFVMKIAKNTMLDILRRRSTRQTLSLSVDNDDGESEEYEIPDPAIDSNPAAAYERQEQIKAVRQAIAELGDEHREMILMRDIQGLSYEEIGEILELEAGTVKSRLFRARAALKKILEKRNFF